MVWKRHLLKGLLGIGVALALVSTVLVWRGNAHERITTKITFNKEIVRIFQKNCMNCHHAGGIAPMALTAYAEVRPWAKAIKEEVLERRMPPWRAVTGYGEFANDPSLSGRDLDLITAWVDGGAPKGEDKDLPQLPDFSKEWQLGNPDLVLRPGTPYTISADGDDEYRCFVLSYSPPQDRWVKAVELRPGDPSVVHHAFIWIDRQGKAEQLDAQDDKPGYACFGGPGFASSGSLGAWVPGQVPGSLSDGLGFLFPANSRLVMQVHYHKSGKETKDQTKVGIYFSTSSVEKRVRDVAIVNAKFEIPPGEARYPVRASYVFQRDAEALSVLPHMHLLGKSMEVRVIRPDETCEVLIWIRDYDFNWQRNYMFKKPIALPKGTRIDVVAYYDNTSENPRNPNRPPRPVRWGESTTDEMCVAYLTYTLKDEHLQQPSP